MSQPTTRWAYVAALAPVIFGTTYLLTTQFLPPGRPLLAALMRSLPTGLVLVAATRTWPPRGWWRRLVLLSVLYSSAFFPLHFIAAYRLPGGVASVINSITPLIVVVLSVPLLHTMIRTIDIVAGCLGIIGVGLLVLRSTAQLDLGGLLAMTTCVIMMGFSTVLTKRWGPPPGWNAAGFTGWTFLLGGLTLLPFTLAIEGLPSELSGRNIGGLVVPGPLQRNRRVRAVVLGAPATAGLVGQLLEPAQPGGRRRARLARPRPATQRLADRGCGDRARVRGAGSEPAAATARASSITDVTDTDSAADRRWPRSVYGVGGEPDPRFSLANERTFLAWIRTSLGFLAAGAGVSAAAHIVGWVGLELKVVSLLLLLCGLLCAAGSFVRWMRSERAMRIGRPLPSSPAMPFLTGALAAVALMAIVVVGLQ